MPRDAFSNYTLPVGNPVVTGTTIASTWANTTLNDIATALTQSLSTDGSTATVNLVNKTMNNGNYGFVTITTATINNITAGGTSSFTGALTLNTSGNWQTSGTITAGTNLVSNGGLVVAGQTNQNGLLNLVGGCIIFPAAQVPQAGANALDDYEEGSWTPTISLQTPGTSSFSYSVRDGKYTKIGRFVHVAMTIVASFTLGAGSAGYAVINGLPFLQQSAGFVPFSVFEDNVSTGGVAAVPSVYIDTPSNVIQVGRYTCSTGVWGGSGSGSWSLGTFRLELSGTFHTST